MKKRVYLLVILIALLSTGVGITGAISLYAHSHGKTILIRDLAAIFTAVIVSGSFIISTLNTKLSADLNEKKILFDQIKFENDKKVVAYNLFKEYNNEVMVGHNQIAVSFMHNNSDLDPIDLIVKLNGDVTSSKSVTMLLNHLELTALSYKESIGDQRLIKELFLDIFKLHYGHFDLYIKTKQKKSANYFDTFEAVVKEWCK